MLKEIGMAFWRWEVNNEMCNWLGNSDLTRIIRTKRIEILPELTHEIIDLKSTRIENDQNIFCLDHFSFQENLIGSKSADSNWNQPELKPMRPETEPELNHVDPKWPDLKLTWSEPKPNDPFARSICKLV